MRASIHVTDSDPNNTEIVYEDTILAGILSRGGVNSDYRLTGEGYNQSEC